MKNIKSYIDKLKEIYDEYNGSHLREENKPNIEEAKQIFDKYNGNYFYMGREKVFSKYKEYHISKQTEILWANELIEDYLCIIKSEKKEQGVMHYLYWLSDIVMNFKNETGYRSMIEIIKEIIGEYDSFTQLRMAEIILETIKSMHFENIDSSTLDYALGILNSIIEQPITISEYRHIKDKSSEYQYEKDLKERAKRKINEWKQYQKP